MSIALIKENQRLHGQIEELHDKLDKKNNENSELKDEIREQDEMIYKFQHKINAIESALFGEGE